MNIAAGLAGLKAAADLTKAMRDAAKAGTLKPDEFAGRVSEIYDYIIDSKAAFADLQGEISAQSEEIRQLKEQLLAVQDIRDNFELRNGVYFRKGTNDAYCPLCLSASRNAVPLVDYGDTWWCGIHKEHFPRNDGGPGFAIIPGPRY